MSVIKRSVLARIAVIAGRHEWQIIKMDRAMFVLWYTQKDTQGGNMRNRCFQIIISVFLILGILSSSIAEGKNVSVDLSSMNENELLELAEQQLEDYLFVAEETSAFLLGNALALLDPDTQEAEIQRFVEDLRRVSVLAAKKLGSENKPS